MEGKGRKRKSTGKKGRKRRNFLKEWGFLRHGLPKVPKMLFHVERFLSRVAHLASYSMVVGSAVIEAFGLLGGPGAFGPEAERGAAWLLGSLAYDCALGLLYAMLLLARSLWVPMWLLPHPDSLAVLGRLALLQSLCAALLHLSVVLRWRRRSSDYRVPPLLPFLAYFAAPWSALSVWMVELRDGDYLLGGGVLRDCWFLSTVFFVRLVVFGQRGVHKAPKEPRGPGGLVTDCVQLGIVVAAFDAAVLRGQWVERRKNWKYIVCLFNLGWPWVLPFVPLRRGESWFGAPMARVMEFFREHGGSRHKAAKASGTAAAQHAGQEHRQACGASPGAGAGARPPPTLPVLGMPSPTREAPANVAGRGAAAGASKRGHISAA